MENKALVLEAFDTLFNKRDYDAAEIFWSPWMYYEEYLPKIRAALTEATKVVASAI